MNKAENIDNKSHKVTMECCECASVIKLEVSEGEGVSIDGGEFASEMGAVILCKECETVQALGEKDYAMVLLMGAGLVDEDGYFDTTDVVTALTIYSEETGLEVGDVKEFHCPECSNPIIQKNIIGALLLEGAEQRGERIICSNCLIELDLEGFGYTTDDESQGGDIVE